VNRFGVDIGGLSLSTALETPAGGELKLEIFDSSAIPSEPPAELFYLHRTNIFQSARMAWRRRDVMYTLAERDIRASYKQQMLGIAWSAITPLMTLAIFTILLHNDKNFQTLLPNGKRVPYALATFAGLWAWGLFGGALGGASGSLVQNKVLMAKTHFPRECFPLSQVLESAFGTMVGLVPFAFLCLIYGYAPKVTTLWVPLYLLVEIPFMVGIVLLVSSVIVQARDLQNVLSILTQFAMLASPVVWPWSRLSKIHVPLIGHTQVVYSVINPLGPVINGIRGSVLIGTGPQWGLLGVALASGMCYFLFGYSVFKRLEVNFADLA
jgi:lipopolysaccharide transport system permease protein